MERRKYRTPPVQEAMCEIRFAPSAEWELPWTWRIYDRLKDDYRGKAREQGLFEAGIHAAPMAASLRLQPQLLKTQFVTEDGLRLVAVGRDVLSIHSLRPYAGWEDLRPRIDGAIAAYRAVAHPRGIARVGLRYVNKILVPGDKIEVREYFRAGLDVPDEFPRTQLRFLGRAELVYEDGATRLVFTFADAVTQPGACAFVIDLDVSRELPANAPLPLDDTMSVVDDLKGRLGTAFEALLTDKTRALFDVDGL